jgi:hypothetical protein
MEVAAVACDQQVVALALLDGEQRIGVRPEFPVDGLRIAASDAAGDFLELQRNALVALRGDPAATEYRCSSTRF